jgi:hypothetical protein
MIYKLRIILDTEQDVIREIAIKESDSLEDLHNATVNAFGFDGTEMASFYMTDDNWNQGAEIPLFDMSENGDAVTMQHFVISDIMDTEKTKLIYVYDFFSLWSFFVELVDIVEDINEYELPALLFTLGVIPDEAPEKEFKSEALDGNINENDADIDIDEFDFDNFDELMN